MLDEYGSWLEAVNLVKCGIGNCIVQENFENCGVYFIIEEDQFYEIGNRDLTRKRGLSYMNRTELYYGSRFKATYK